MAPLLPSTAPMPHDNRVAPEPCSTRDSPRSQWRRCGARYQDAAATSRGGLFYNNATLRRTPMTQIVAEAVHADACSGHTTEVVQARRRTTGHR